jgi:4-hydroxyphenylpyruvate dioxygenase
LTITPFPPGRYSIDELADHLTAYAEKMGRHGITCVVEAMPMWGLRTLAEVEELRRQTRATNVRILFDTWHYMRGGRNDAIIAQIPTGIIDHVQIADGTLCTPPGRSLFDDCLNHRVPPGEGEMPLTEILRALDAAGHLRSVGPEVFSAAMDGLQPEEIANRLMPPFEASLRSARA